MNLDELTRRRCVWLRGDGPDPDVVIACRIRLLRNLSGFSFVDRASTKDLQTIVEQTAGVVARKFPEGNVETIDLAPLSSFETQLLCERLFIDPKFAGAERPRAIALEKDEKFSVVVNASEHLELQVATSGLALRETLARVNELDDALGAELDYAFDERLGYLTSSPADVGTGLRASVILHLPALIATGEIQKVARALQKINLGVCGLCDGDPRALGDLFQIHNNATLGASEETIVDRLCEIASRIVEYERKARETLLENDREGLLDRCYRAMGLLSSAREMSLEEASTLLSSLRLGARMGLLDCASIELVDEMQTTIRPAHLRQWAEAEGVFDDENISRAEYLRRKLTPNPNV